MEKHEISKWLLQEYVGYEEGGQLTPTALPASIFNPFDELTSLRYVQHNRVRFWMMVVSQIYKFPREDIVIIMISNDNSQYIPKTNNNSV
jgi:hypothetical protein